MNYLAFFAPENLCVNWRIKLSAITFSTVLGTSGTAVACLDTRNAKVWPVEVSSAVNPRRKVSAADGAHHTCAATSRRASRCFYGRQEIRAILYSIICEPTTANLPPTLKIAPTLGIRG